MADIVAAPAASATAIPANAENNTQSNDTLDTSSDSEGDIEGLDTDSEESSSKVPAAKKPSSKEAKAIENRIKKLKLKVDGKEIEQDFNPDDEEGIIRELQMSKMGQKRAQEKAELEKQVQSFISQLQKDPFSVLSKEMGMDPNQLIEAYINQQLENSKKTPAEIEREQLQRELESLKSEREREKQTLQQRELERLQQQEFERYDSSMEKALMSSKLPKTPYVVKKMADLMLIGLKNGYDVTPEDVLPLVEQELNSDLQELFQSLPEDEVEKLLGEQVLNKLRKRRVAKAKESAAAVGNTKVQDTGAKNRTESDKPKEKINYKDFFKM